MAFLGIDLGTGGVRCLLVEENGEILGKAGCPLQRLNVATTERASEQDPVDWISALESALDDLFSRPGHRNVRAVAVDSTSGTVLPVSDEGDPLGTALLYNDMRATEEAESCAEVFDGASSPTFSLPKILWMQRHRALPDNCLFLHATDYLNSWLAGTTALPTDFTNGMKSGVDLETQDWPAGMPAVRLPGVVAPGRRIGVLRKDLQTRWQLAGEVILASGATDSNAAFYASGASGPGDWSTTIGTTLAVKGVSTVKLTDADARIYCHKHPDGDWLPGGASNAGGEIVQKRFGSSLKELEVAALERRTTNHLIYPSIRKGERLPYASASFAPFFLGPEDDEVGAFLGCVEGVACVEALVYELIESLGGTIGDTIFATGGAARSALSLQLRADLLQKSLSVPAHPNSVMGAAVLAAAGFHGDPVGLWSRRLVRIERMVEPDPGRASYFHDRLGVFREQCERSLGRTGDE